jgi:hypothetical protein
MVTGGIFTSTTWTKANSPYIVTANLILFDDLTLTIEPGVVVRFNPGTSLKLNNSKLYAVGTVTDSITFTSNAAKPAKGDWEGINSLGANTQSYPGDQVTFQYVKGLYANTLFTTSYNVRTINFSNSSFGYNVSSFIGGQLVNIDQCTFFRNSTGVNGPASVRTFKVMNSTFDGNVIGADNLSYVENCTFRNNTKYGLFPYGIVKGCHFENNLLGVYSPFYNSENDTFINNVVINNVTGIQMGTYFNGYITFTGNKICNNTLYNVERLEFDNAANLADNCWCSTDSAYIESKIKDAKDDINLALVTFSPFDKSGTCIGPVTEIENKPAANAYVNVTLSPNPAQDLITLKGLHSDAFLQLVSQEGHIVKTSFCAKYQEATIPLSELKSGIYAVLLDGQFFKKIVKL